MRNVPSSLKMTVDIGDTANGRTLSSKLSCSRTGLLAAECTHTHTHTHTRTHTHTHTHINHKETRTRQRIQAHNVKITPYPPIHAHLTALFQGKPEWAGTRIVKVTWILLKQETVSGSGISWAICKSAPRSRQITTPAPHHSVFYRPDALPAVKALKAMTELSPATVRNILMSRRFASSEIQRLINTIINKEITAFPLSWLQTFQDFPGAFFQDPVVSQQCLNIETNSSY